MESAPKNRTRAQQKGQFVWKSSLPNTWLDTPTYCSPAMMHSLPSSSYSVHLLTKFKSNLGWIIQPVWKKKKKISLRSSSIIFLSFPGRFLICHRYPHCTADVKADSPGYVRRRQLLTTLQKTAFLKSNQWVNNAHLWAGAKKEALEKKALASIAGETMLLQHEPVEKERCC